MENIFSKNLRAVRESLNFSQDEFAKPLGISGKNISKLERGNSSPSNPVLILIEIKYRISREWLLAGKGQKYLDQKENEKDSERKMSDSEREWFQRQIDERNELIKDLRSENKELNKEIKELMDPQGEIDELPSKTA